MLLLLSVVFFQTVLFYLGLLIFLPSWVGLEGICKANNQGALLLLNCQGCCTWTHVSGSLNEKHPSLSRNLSCCDWLLRGFVMRPEENIHDILTKGGFEFTASRCTMWKKWVLSQAQTSNRFLSEQNILSAATDVQSYYRMSPTLTFSQPLLFVQKCNHLS